MELSIDRDRCEGTGFCVRLLPQLVELDRDRRAVRRGSAAGVDPEELQEVEAMCPTNAIRLQASDPA